MATMRALEAYKEAYVVEWRDLLNSDPNVPWASFPDHPEMFIHFMEVVSGAAGPVGVEVSNELVTESGGVAHTATTVDGTTAVSLAAAGQGSYILESGVKVRPVNNAGAASNVRIRIKFSRIR